MSEDTTAQTAPQKKADRLESIRSDVVTALKEIARTYVHLSNLFDSIGDSKGAEFYAKKQKTAAKQAAWYDPIEKKKVKVEALKEKLAQLEKELAGEA